MICFAGFSHFFPYMKIICQISRKKSDCKSQITYCQKRLQSQNVFSINRHFSIFVNLSKVVGITLPPPIPLSYLRRWDGNFERDFFYKNMKDAFNKGLSYLNHFVALYLFVRRSQILSTFLRHLTLIKRNSSKRKISLIFRIKFKQFDIYFKCIEQIVVCIYIIC